MLFTDHVASAEQQLIDAISQFRAAGITDLILDLRYNSGGFLDIASELAFMIAGPDATAGKAFLRETFNDKHPTVNPVTGEPLTPLPFFDRTQGYAVKAGNRLFSLDLPRVFVLTGLLTCSASEAIMNGLAGAGVEVVQIGTTTCGKPYGFFPQDNCGTTFFAIQFQDVNDQGFGEYADGFVPGGVLPGCTVADDFDHALGDPEEARIAAALAFRRDRSCAAIAARRAEPAATEGVIARPLWLQDQIAMSPSARQR